MIYLSRLFQPVVTIPKNAKIKNTEITCKSQKLLLECGLVRPTGTGLFALLPLAQRALDKLQQLVQLHVEATGAQRCSLPALTAATLWERSGRLRAAGAELMKVQDRHGKSYILAPTHEEAISDLLADIGPLSYKQLPLLLYQVGSKYRDEARPKHGVLRARQFVMLDAYGAHGSERCARATYGNVADAYRNLFAALHLPVYRVEAPSGDMGGSLSHEWQLCADAGEDTIVVCSSCSHAVLSTEPQPCTKCGSETKRLNSIEVGHTFVLGVRYSEPLQALYVIGDRAEHQPLHMACYGIGITRLLAASLEALSTDTALRWPAPIAPYSTLLIGPKEGSKEWAAHGWDTIRAVHERLSAVPGLSNDVLLDDRHHLTIGKRLMMADKMGYPTVVVCGRAAAESPPRYELHRTGGEAPRLLTLDETAAALSDSRAPEQQLIYNKL